MRWLDFWLVYEMQEGGCDLYEWYEGPWDPFVQNLLVDLRDVVWDLKRERAILAKCS